MAMNPDQIYSKLEAAANEYSDKDAAASLLEELKGTMLSQCAADWPQDSMASAESKAKRDPRYIEHVTNMVNARMEANKAKAKYYSIQTWIDLMRTKESTEREKIKRGI